MSVFKKIYNRINWQNKPSTETPINADNLNKMDKAIEDLDDRVVSLSKSVETNTNDISDLKSDVSANSEAIADLSKYKIVYYGNNSTWQFISEYFAYNYLSYESMGITKTNKPLVVCSMQLNNWSYTGMIPMGQPHSNGEGINLALNNIHGNFTADDIPQISITFMVLDRE